MKIFKAYDIRGTVPDQLDEEVAYAIGRASAHFIRGRREGPVVVGRDARPHSPGLAGALIRGILDEGADVQDIGLVGTPVLYFAVEALAAAGGVMVTASHNPAAYNGFKVCLEHAIPVGEASGLKEIEALCGPRSAASPAKVRGRHLSIDVIGSYVDHVLEVGEGRPKIKVAIDNGNGMASVGLRPLLARLDIDLVPLYMEPDGTFPNHEADPLKRENLKDLCAAVEESGADVGVAFDGDGDRAVFVDEKGEPIPSDLMTAILARPQLARHPGGLVLYDLRSSRAVAEEVEAAGGKAEMCRVGHSFVKAQMRESGAIFAGELSGHLYFRFSDELMADDGTAGFVALLDVLAKDERPLSQIVAPLRRYAASGEINRKVKDTAAVIDAIEKEHEGAPFVSRLDGLLVRYDDWWFNLRPSNTEPVLRLNLEADTEVKMVEERDRILARVEALGSV